MTDLNKIKKSKLYWVFPRLARKNFTASASIAWISFFGSLEGLHEGGVVGSARGVQLTSHTHESTRYK